MEKIVIEQVLIGAATAFFALFTFLVRHYFASIRKDIHKFGEYVAKVDGRVETLIASDRINVAAIAGLSAESRALWRMVDGAHNRASDNGSGHG